MGKGFALPKIGVFVKLYEINKELAAKMTALGELLLAGETPSDEQVAELIDLQGNLSNKLTSYGYVVKNLTSELDAVDAELKRLTAIKRAKASHIEMLKSRMLTAMQDGGIDKVADPVMPIRLQNSPVSVRISTDIDALPNEFVKVKYDADKTALAKALKCGIKIDGVELVQSQHIRIG